jgi:hypothetical protein
MRDFLNLSADLARISEFYSRGDDNLALKFIERGISKYGQLTIQVGNQSIWELLTDLKQQGTKEERSTKAMTASLLITHIANAAV